MSRICLDTSAYSHFRRGEQAAVEIITTAREVCVPVIVLGELRSGFRAGSRHLDSAKELRRFLAHPAVRVIDVDDEIASLYSDVVVELRRAGTPIPTNDLWIAATAIREGTSIVTYDGHFRLVPRVGARILAASSDR